MDAAALRSLSRPGPPELNLYLFLKEAEAALGDLEHEVLQHVVAAGTARGWFPTVPALIERISEHEPRAAVESAVAKVVAYRLLEVSSDGRILGTLSGITHERTAFRAVADGGVPFHLRSALDVMTIAATLQKETTVSASCAQTAAAIRLDFDAAGQLTNATPRTVTAFLAGWDGSGPLGPALARGGLFVNDAALEAWQRAHGDPDGLPLTEDTFRSVGMEMAQALAAKYVAVSVFGVH